ncbi:MAG: septum formation inhibitor Maf [Methylophilaceae bacterium]|nr:septum formation inhibitor Maf [Methylophilaceae bacterium]
MTTPKLILASSSSYRSELLQRLQLPFTVASPDIDETAWHGELPEQTSLRLAKAKAIKIAESNPNSLIIGCDQIATLDSLQIGKPGTHENAVKQLKMMRGRNVVFYSALCLYNAQTRTMQAEVVPFIVKFRNLTDTQIENYLLKEQPYNCAGSAKSEGLGIAIIASMQGDDPNALIGLPLIRLVEMLENESIAVI